MILHTLAPPTHLHPHLSRPRSRAATQPHSCTHATTHPRNRPNSPAPHNPTPPLVQMDPAKRATLQQLKNHPWFAVAEAGAAAAAGGGGAGAGGGAANGKAGKALAPPRDNGDSALDGSVTQSDSSEQEEAARGAQVPAAAAAAAAGVGAAAEPEASGSHPKAEGVLEPQAVSGCWQGSGGVGP